MNRILLVNDCKFERVVMKDMLTSLGYEVYTSDEYGVLTKIKELSPNILICNLLMKETKGNLLVGKAKEVFPNIKCYVSSNNDIKLEEYKDNDVNGVIKTPTDLSKLS
jgi:CheY-like chemotaxis protein